MSMNKTTLCKHSLQCRERGVVLVISLVILIVISMLSVSSLRSVSASEITSGNVRKTEMANQAAEFVLRYCEEEVTKFKNGEATAISINDYADPPLWDAIDPKTKALTNWDGAGTSDKINVPDSSMLNQTSLKYATYRRLPECMIEPTEDKSPADATVFRITARGFGPEVSAVDNKRSRPNGSEAWLQSTITVN
ncbi:MAG: hypothetical protein FD135_4546 [Comamonadaceae bacterium]|nr:MAG: hypothetical protein FD135_4546 [Comamonadaceae bacterium]